MTQLAAANRIYQRLSDTDGGEGKGQGIVPVTIEATQSGTVQARCRSAADGTTILQAAWDAATIAASGAQTLAIGGVDARLGWFYLDLLDSSGSWQLGTTPIGMGSLTAVGGQSLMSRFLGRVNGEDTTTLAMLGIVPSPYGRAFVKYTDGGTHDATAWERPADAAQSAAPTSAGVAELLNLQIAALGVNCGVIGYARGATAIATWQAGQTDGTELAAVMANAGGAFERFFWFQGHGDAAASTSSYASYYAALASFFASIASLNARSFAIYLTAIPNINSASWGSSPKRSEIRKAQEDWAADNGATCLGFADLELYSDGIHEIQAGARRVARHLCRAMLAENGPGNDEGPRVIRATKAGTDITLDVAHARGTTLTGIGNPGTRFLVTRAWDPALGALALDGTVPIALSAEAITLRLASDPGDIPLDVWPMRADPTNNGAADAIYDDDDPEGFGVGRQLQAATVPVRTRRNTPLNTAVAGYVTSYGPGRFGQGRASGEMRGPYNGLIGKPYTGLTIDFWLTPANVSISGTKVLVSSSFSTWIGVNAASLIYQVGDSASTTISGLTLAAGQSYHFRLCIDPGGRSWRFHVNGVLRSSGTGAANIGYSIGSPFIIGGHETTPGAYHYAQGVIDEVAIFGHPLGAGDFTPPTSPWSGAEPGLLHLWHCDGNGLDSAGLDGSA